MTGVRTCALPISAFVVAGAGVRVAKHGNKALSSKAGTADALTAMGVNVMVEAPVAERSLAEAGVSLKRFGARQGAMSNT